MKTENKMNITTDGFDSNYHNAYIHTYLNAAYLRHNIDVTMCVEIDGKSFDLVYQTGCEFYNNDVNSPSSELSLSIEGGTSQLLCDVNDLYESDIDNIDTDDLLDFTDLCSSIDSVDKLRQLYNFINDNKPEVLDFVENLSNDPDDYTISDETHVATPKK